jgi:deazaflavin-dependent oxidoreductase (nitroreductase family)
MSWNESVIKEFRENHGKVGGNFKGSPILLFHHVGARTGKARVNPVMYYKDGDRCFIFASKGGADRNPDWYYNLKAHPDIKVEIGDDTFDMRAEEIRGPERDRIYARWAKLFPFFGEYQQKTKRVIPVIELTRKKR